MSKLIKLLVILFMLGSCSSSSKVSKSGFTEMGYVSEFITLMINNASEDELMKFISPTYLSENNLNKTEYAVTSYAPLGYRIENYVSGLVYAKIWGKDRKWVHRLTFRVVKEEKKLYLMPGKHYDKFIDPWQRVEKYLVE